MGTSVSQGSPGNSNAWRALVAAYQNAQFGTQRLVQMVWRAASTDHTSDIAVQLAQPAVGSCLMIAVAATTAAQAASSAAREIARQRASNLGTEVARRAAVQCFATEDRASGFAQSLFAEASNYLVSRDISALVGKSGRLTSAGDAIELKDRIIEAVRTIVDGAGSPPQQPGPDEWGHYVQTVVRRLRQ